MGAHVRAPFPAGDRCARDAAATSFAPHPVPPGTATATIHMRDLDNGADLTSLAHRYPYMAGSASSRLLAHHAGRTCAGAALAALGSAERERQPLLRGSAGEPLWPTGFIGSITHTSDFACAVVASSQSFAGIGIDSERLVDAAVGDDIATVCLTAAERQRLLLGPLLYRRWTATVIFCVKEAFYKAAYPLVGRYIDFDELEVLHVDFGTGRVKAHTSVLAHEAPALLDARFAVRDEDVHACVVLSNADDAGT
jgi:enterobactin synthetase component D